MSRRRRIAAGLLLLLATAGSGAAEYVLLPGGALRTALPPDGRQAPARVKPFFMRTTLVTNAEFLDFVRAHPQWRRGVVPQGGQGVRYH